MNALSPLHLDPVASQWRLVDGEILGLDLRTEEYFSLTGSSALLWQRLANGATLVELAELLVTRYGIEHATAVQDVAAFLGDIRHRRLLMP